MKSILIISKNKKGREEYALSLCNDYKINKFEITELEREDSIGIEEVRSIQKNLFFFPKLGKLKAVIIKTDDNLTIQAQNALLKILEEPPMHTIIIITASSKESLIPTVLSRTTFFELDTKKNKESVEAEITADDFSLESIRLLGVGEKLKMAQEISESKEETLLFLEKTISTLRRKLIDLSLADKKDPLIVRYLTTLTSLNKTHTLLSKTNANPRLTLETLFLQL